VVRLYPVRDGPSRGGGLFDALDRRPQRGFAPARLFRSVASSMDEGLLWSWSRFIKKP